MRCRSGKARWRTKVEIDGAAGGLTIGPSRSGSIAPPKPKCAAPDSSATTRQGIKSTIPPARNVGEKARRRPSQRGFRSGVLAPSTPLLHSGRIVVRSDRPSSIVAPNRNITKVEIGDVGQRPQRRPGQVEQHRAAEAKMRRAGVFGHHPLRDKEHHLASRKCRRESTPQTPLNAVVEPGCCRTPPPSSRRAASASISAAPLAHA